MPEMRSDRRPVHAYARCTSPEALRRARPGHGEPESHCAPARLQPQRRVGAQRLGRDPRHPQCVGTTRQLRNAPNQLQGRREPPGVAAVQGPRRSIGCTSKRVHSSASQMIGRRNAEAIEGLSDLRPKGFEPLTLVSGLVLPSEVSAAHPGMPRPRRPGESSASAILSQSTATRMATRGE